MQIQIWKPTDLDLHCLQRQGISGISRRRVKTSPNKCKISHWYPCQWNEIEPAHDKTYNKTCETRKDSNQLVYPPSMAMFCFFYPSLDSPEAVEGRPSRGRGGWVPVPLFPWKKSAFSLVPPNQNLDFVCSLFPSVLDFCSLVPLK